MTTDVSSTPRRRSTTRRRILVDVAVDVFSELREIDSREMGGRLDELCSRHERPASDRRQPSDGNAVSRNHERVATLERANDFCVIISQLALRDRPFHIDIVAQRLQLQQLSISALRAAEAITLIPERQRDWATVSHRYGVIDHSEGSRNDSEGRSRASRPESRRSHQVLLPS